ncbi:hypothetical protein LTR10_022463 [Elasticomyces elasticus]|uniref:FAD/NAD(P)-binding domain-containing protein n=1 Tax=Exophiala sideris TaxID=1016849 RepID=A0ABR0J2Y7_9EURO|nr:hypothetical protein LTR10_022463 [Elasticomyces elasticus]KAK5024900.1 hypothetical protein LTS07_008278 [Exophiala sideris]KAK5031510.1 hypothetical protein LTR13_007838 [Exophiala sideris]KAK5054939.1 hypothetical protein LTR69_008507 [Exophiala sideris]KAK5179818.1 hypothetical protein LTR44_007634 [Eurotiomycetes sp. CCFEE 6388]
MVIAVPAVPPPVEVIPGETRLNGTTQQPKEVNGVHVNGESHSGYTIEEQWHSQPSHLRVIHVGAGATGLLVAYKMQKEFKDYSLVCYEKNPEVAGTWFENRYPGCACDVPAHAYTYSFEPNPNWSTFYAYAPEIKRYFQDFAEKYGLMRYVQLNSKVVSAVWDEAQGMYKVEVDVAGTRVSDWCHVLINGTGFLNSWKWPSIPGLHSFGGQLMHSASWDSSCDWSGKRVAVIGTGSSAIQIVPQLQKTAKHLTTFMRSVTWISPVIADNALTEHQTEAHEDQSQAQHYYTEEEKRRFADDPEFHLKYRKRLESAMNSMYELFLKGSEASKKADALLRKEMIRRIGPGHEELKEKLIPKWPPGCRRLTPGDGYLEALVKPNVTRVHKEIARIVPEGVMDESGTLHEVNILVCATGFNLAFAPSLYVGPDLMAYPFRSEVKGVNGVTMADEFNPEPQVYLATTVPKFPNYFVINGVRGNWAAGTSIPTHEACVEYTLKIAKRIQAEQIRAVEVKQEPVNELYEHLDAFHKRTVFDADCKSWYKNNIVGGRLWVWGASGLHFMKTLQTVRYEDYDIRFRNANRWAYLGYGRTEAEVKGDVANLTPYLRNADTPWTMPS